LERLGRVVDDQAKVTRGNGLASDRLEGDELVTQIHERHPAGSPAKRYVVEDLREKRKHLVDVADLDRDVVDPDKTRHGARVALRL
jgi:hypothetical protein